MCNDLFGSLWSFVIFVVFIEFDPDLVLLELVKEVTPTIHITRTHVAAPYPISHREFLDMRTWVEGKEREIE